MHCFLFITCSKCDLGVAYIPPMTSISIIKSGQILTIKWTIKCLVNINQGLDHALNVIVRPLAQAFDIIHNVYKL